MISVMILTYNSDQTLAKTLDSVQDFEEVIVVDSGSTDHTKDIATSYSNVRFIESAPFPGFGPQRKRAERGASLDWILALDSDEILSKELKEEIFSLDLDQNTIYSIPRHNYFGKKRIHYTSWSPDYCLRLYHKETTGFDDALVHENIRKEGCKIKKLKKPILHTPYRTISDLLKKMESYSSYSAEQKLGKVPPSFSKAIFRSTWAFIKDYFIKRGFLDGKEGFIISLYNAHCTYYKYLKLYQMSKDTSVTT